MMTKKSRKNRTGIVYSTNPDYEYDDQKHEIISTPENKDQKLKVFTDKKQRKGKIVTIVEGFIGRKEDFESLAKKLKTYCGAGGTAKNDQIIIQGDCMKKVKSYLINENYNVLN